MSDNQPQPQNVETILREFSMSIVAPVINGGQRQPRLTIGIYKNKPTISVKTNDPNDNGRDNGRISVEPGIPDFFAIKNALKMLIADKTPRKIPVDLKAKRFAQGGQLSQDKMLNARLLMGRDERGVIFISCIHWNKDRPVIKFNFGPTVTNREEVIWGDGQGGIMDPAAVSELYAAAWCDIVDSIVSHLAVIGYKPQEQRQGGQGGGGYQNRGQQGGGGQGGYQNRNNGGGNGGGGNSYQQNRGGNNGGGQPSSGGGAAGGGFDGFEEDDLPI